MCGIDPKQKSQTYVPLRLSYLNYIYIITNYALYLYLYIHLYTVNYIYLAKLLCELNENAYVEVFSTVADNTIKA